MYQLKFIYVVHVPINISEVKLSYLIVNILHEKTTWSQDTGIVNCCQFQIRANYSCLTQTLGRYIVHDFGFQQWSKLSLSFLTPSTLIPQDLMGSTWLFDLGIRCPNVGQGQVVESYDTFQHVKRKVALTVLLRNKLPASGQKLRITMTINSRK